MSGISSAGCAYNAKVYVGEPSERLKQDIRNGKELSFTLPETMFIYIINAGLQQNNFEKFKAMPADKRNVEFFLISHHNENRELYYSLIQPVILKDRDVESDIRKVSFSVFQKLNHVKGSLFITLLNLTVIYHGSDEPFVLNYEQAELLTQCAANINGLLKNFHKGATSYPLAPVGSTQVFPKPVAKLTHQEVEAPHKLLETFSCVIDKEDTLELEGDYPTSETGWRVYQSNDPERFICILRLKDPKIQSRIVAAFCNEGFQAKSMKTPGMRDSLVVVLLSKSEPANTSLRKFQSAANTYQKLAKN